MNRIASSSSFLFIVNPKKFSVAAIGPVKCDTKDVKSSIRHSTENTSLTMPRIESNRRLRVSGRYRRQTCTETPTDLFTAAANGDLDAVKGFIVDQHVDVNESIRGSGETALFKAAQGGHMSVVEFLVNNGADVKHMDRWGYNVLIWAVDSNNADVQLIQYLINSGAEVNVKDKRKGYTALHWAADHGRLDTIRLLVDRGAEFNIATNDGETPMNIAAINGHLDVVTYFMEEKRLNYRGDIFAATVAGYLGFVRYMIERKGANVAQKDNVGQTLLHKAAENGRLSVVRYLVDKGMDFNVRGEYKNTPLHTAAFNGHLSVVRYLVEEKRADVRVKNINGNMALHDAAINGKVDVVRYFLEECGMDMNVTGDHGNTPLHMASYSGQLPVVKYLVEQRRAAMDVRNMDLNTPLHDAVLNDRLEIVQYLVGQRAADVNVKGQWGNSPLHWAANRGYMTIMKYLVEVGHANLDVPNNDGNTPLHDAVASGDLDSVKYLVGRGANVNAKNYRGTSPTVAASQANKSDIAAYLQTLGGARRRRSVGDGAASTSSAGRPSFFVASVVGWIANSVTGFVPSIAHKPMAARPAANSAFVDGVLVLLDMGVRRWSGQRYEQPMHESLLSAADILRRRVDGCAGPVMDALADGSEIWWTAPNTQAQPWACVTGYVGSGRASVDNYKIVEKFVTGQNRSVLQNY